MLIAKRKVVKHKEYIIEKLNDLLVLNQEIKNSYSKVSNKVTNPHYKTFSNKRSLEHEEFARLLENELNKVKEQNKNFLAVKRRSQIVRLNFKKQLKFADESSFYDKVFEIQLLALKEYDEFLALMNLPLPLCKSVLKQRDSIQVRMYAIERGDGIDVS